MALTSGKEILTKARECTTCAIGGFDGFNMESVQGIMAAAEQMKTPVFLQFCVVSLQYAGMGWIAALAREAVQHATVPVCIHMDHGPEPTDREQVIAAMNAGFNSVMVDGSGLDFEENIAMTRAVVKIAHGRGVCVEGELGKVSRNINAGPEELQHLMTDPGQAARFVEKTGVDYLAVSVGSVSGFYRGDIHLDLERLELIGQNVDVPLVFHGGTSIPEAQIKEAVRLGVKKVNIAHGVRKAFWDGVSQGTAEYDKTRTMDPRVILGQGRSSVTDYVMQKMVQFGGRNDELS